MKDGRYLVTDHDIGDQAFVAHVANLQRPPFDRFPISG
jgi:hypothetical protein